MKVKNLHSPILLLFLFANAFLFSQNNNLPICYFNNIQLQRLELKLDSNHTFNHQQFCFQVTDTTPIFSTLKPFIGIECITNKSAKNWFVRKLFHDDLISFYDSSLQFKLAINPALNIQLGKDLLDTGGSKLYTNTRGITIRSSIGEKFSFESSFYESQSTFPNYIKQFADTFKVVPGQGRWKNFKLTGYDYAFSSGTVNFSPSPNWRFQLGHGKLFIGDGYRSLFLSDNAFNYPYLRINKQFNRISYSAIYAQLMNFTSGKVKTPVNTEPLFQKKAASFQFVDIAVTRFLNIGFFQGMIWQAADTNNRQHISAAFLNPVIGVSPMLFGLNQTQNVSVGMSAKIKIHKSLVVYGQWLIDDLPKNKFNTSINNKNGYQAGISWFNAFTLKNLNLQAEYNTVRPYTYSHKKTEQNYSHYNQPLAHPLQSNFSELVSIATYNYKRLAIFIKYNYAKVGLDSAGKNYGQSIFQSNNNAYYGVNSTNNEHLQGIKTNISTIDTRISFIIKPITSLKISLGYITRVAKNNLLNQQTNFVYISLQTQLSNFYVDF